MYIIENEAHDKISEHKNLSKVKRPDGGWSTNVKVGDPIHDEGGGVYFIQQVLEPIVGEGPRNLGWGPLEYVDGSWQRENRIGPAREPTPDPEPGDEMYNYTELRKRDYGDYGDQLDMMFHDLLDGTSTWKDHISEVKNAFPKPVEEVDAEVVEVDTEVVEVDAETE